MDSSSIDLSDWTIGLEFNADHFWIFSWPLALTIMFAINIPWLYALKVLDVITLITTLIVVA